MSTAKTANMFGGPVWAGSCFGPAPTSCILGSVDRAQQGTDAPNIPNTEVTWA